MLRHRPSRDDLYTTRRTPSAEPLKAVSAGPSSLPSSRSSLSSIHSMLSLSVFALVAVLSSSLASFVRAAAPYEPAGNQVLFGAWLDSQAGYSDTPVKFNARLGLNVPVFQIAQAIPLPKYNYTTGAGGAALENLIELSQTDAAVFLTVYPQNGFAAVADSDFNDLGLQILDYQKTLNRTVFLRYAPEMQGLWNTYGNQPAAFNDSFHTMYTTIKSIAPETIIVWAPNTPQGYPYGQELSGGGNTAADQAALDTNGDGELTSDDDALSPYYPGDAYVDWVGISLYYKGTGSSDMVNVAQTSGYCAAAINGTNPSDGTAISNWYTPYCANKPDKACMLAESGAAWHVNDVAASGSTSDQLELQTAWINDCIANPTFLDEFPRLKLIMQFEYEKVEDSNTGVDDLRDYRVTNDTEILQVLQSGFASAEVSTRFSWANFRAQPTSISSAGAPAATNSAGSTVVQAITATTRDRPTSFPSLFGLMSGARSLRNELVELAVLVTSGIAGAWVVMRMV